MKRIYAPWRSRYITKSRPERVADGCPFCGAFAASDSAAEYIIARTEHTVTMLNRYPYTSGHLMVLPVRHCGVLHDLSEAEHAELFREVTYAVSVLERVFRVEGMNVGINIGKHGGGGIPAHLHVHVVPRWENEGGFLQTIAETVVVSRPLEEVHVQLVAAWGK